MKIVRRIFIFLTLSTLKHQEACKGPRPGQSVTTLTPLRQNSERHEMTEVLPRDKPKSRPYDFAETEHRWWKDHEMLVPPDTQELTQRTHFDKSVLALRKKLKFHDLLNRDKRCVERITLKNKGGLRMNDNWDIFFSTTSNCHMYPDKSEARIRNLLDDMLKLNVTRVENFAEGTQIKLKLTFENGRQAMFKPIRFDTNYEADPNQFYYNELERPNAEIVAFHLDKLLGFRRAVPTVGRVFNISKELQEYTPKDAGLTYYTSPANNLCFVGKCKQYCDTAHAICAVAGTIRGSVQAWLPDGLFIVYKRSPYRFNNVEEEVRKRFGQGRVLLDLVDLSIFDFLTGNQDRHGYEWFRTFDYYLPATEQSFIIPLDNGRAFGNPHFDDPDYILVPLTQHCVVRPSTVKTLLNFYDGKISLGKALQMSMMNDTLHPVLATKYLVAIDRRVEIVLQQVVKCLTNANNKAKHVFMNKFDPNAIPRASGVQQRKGNSGVETKKQGYVAEWKGIQQMPGRSRKDDDMMLRGNPDGVQVSRRLISDDLRTILESKLAVFKDADVPCPNEKTQEEVLIEMKRPISVEDRTDTWIAFYAEMSDCYLYKNNSEAVKNLIKAMTELDVKSVASKSDRNFEQELRFGDGRIGIAQLAIFKPKRFSRNYETNPNHFYFDDFERHHAEIAAFHLDRLLGLRRVPPTVGRVFKIKSELLDKLVSARTIKGFVSPTGNRCFFGTESEKNIKYSDFAHAICGDPDNIEGSVQVLIPTDDKTFMPSPYGKIFTNEDFSIHSNRTNDQYCNLELKPNPPYNNGRLLLDLVDLHIFDFLTGNQHRDQLMLFRSVDKNAALYIYFAENGKAFGNPHIHDLTILAPLTQCCIVRPSTVRTLLKFNSPDSSLGQQLDDSLKDDPLYPILATKYLNAINRRVEIILQEVGKCLKTAEETGDADGVLLNSFQYVQK